MKKLPRIGNKINMFVKVMNDFKKDTLTIFFVVLAVLTSSSIMRNKAIHIFSQPIMMRLEGYYALAEQHEESSGSATKDKHDHNHSSSESLKVQKHDKTYKVSETFKEQLDQVFKAYFHIQFALSHDNVENAQQGAEHLQKALSNVDMSLVTGEAHMAWMKELKVINKSGKQIADAEDINLSRTAFIHLSQSMINVAKMFGTSGSTVTYRFHCPMADNNKGADWLQNKPELENPFFGSSMFKCGELVETLTNNH